jgi:hypothetical protein
MQYVSQRIEKERESGDILLVDVRITLNLFLKKVSDYLKSVHVAQDKVQE